MSVRVFTGRNAYRPEWVLPGVYARRAQIRRYLAKISGPLLDRIDIHIEVPCLSREELMGKRMGESSATVRRRVVRAREKQFARMGKYNGQMKAKKLRDYFDMDSSTRDLLKAAIAQFNLSGRGYDRISRCRA